MKILQIIPNLRKGGAERLVLDICNELSKREDIVVKLVTFSSENEYQNISKNIDLTVISASVKLSFLRRNLYNINELQNFIEEFEPDIIHTHLFEAELVSRSCNYPKAKWFSHGHDNMIQFENFSGGTIIRKKRLTDYYEKRFLFRRYRENGGNHFIAISEHTKKYFQKTVKPWSVLLLHNAIDFRSFYRKNEFEKKNNKLHMVNTGSFVDKKNQSFLIDVARILKENDVPFELHLLGDGPNKLKILEKINVLNLQQEVYLYGNVNNVQEYLWQSDMYVHSATYEPLGLVLIEAMAAALPVITLDGKGNRDLIEEGKNGYMLYTQNAEEFADKIMELWNNQEKYREMSSHAQQYAKRYDIKAYVDNLMNLYEKNFKKDFKK